MTARSIVRACATLVLGTLLLPSPARPQIARETALTTAEWQQDLDELARRLPASHRNLFTKISREEFERRAAALRAEIPRLDADAVLVGLLRLGAAAGDAHTGVAYLPPRAVPIKSWWFADGIHILDTTAEYADLLYGRLVAVGGQPIDEVVARLAGIIPHENEAQVRQKAVNYLSSPDLLHGLGVIPTAESVSLTVEHDDGRRVTQEFTPVDRTTRPAWVAGSNPATDEPLYRRNGSLAYWFEKLTDSHVLYVKYNSCRDMPDAPFADFVRQVFAAFDAEPGWKLVIDLRDNGGGNSAVFEPFLEALEARPVSRTEGHLYVIVGRRTFSSAILNAVDLRKRTAAVFVGEPTGGKPNHFGELQMFRLPNSGLTVTYSVKYFKEVDGDPDSFYPDITVEPTFADYLAGLDPVLDRVLDNRSAPSSRPGGRNLTSFP